MADLQEDEGQTGIRKHKGPVERHSNRILSLVHLPGVYPETSSPPTSPPSSSSPQTSVIPRYLQGWVGGRFHDPTVTRFNAIGAARFPDSPSESSLANEESADDPDGHPDDRGGDKATVCPTSISRVEKPSHRVTRVLGVRSVGWTNNTPTIRPLMYDKFMRGCTRLQRDGCGGETDQTCRRRRLVLRLLGAARNITEMPTVAPPGPASPPIRPRTQPDRPLSVGLTFRTSLRHAPLLKLNIVLNPQGCQWCLSDSMHSHITFGPPSGLRLPGLNLPSDQSEFASRMCGPCCVTRMVIVAHPRHGPWLDSMTAPFIAKPEDPLFRRMLAQTCDVCTGTAAVVCADCPLMVCVNCQVVLDGMCAGELDELIGALGLNNVRMDACLLLRRPIDQIRTY